MIGSLRHSLQPAQGVAARRRRRRLPTSLLSPCWAPRWPPRSQDCPTSFVDAIGSASTNTWLFRQGLKLAGAEDKLPNPNALPVTILVPSDKAWLDFFWRNGAPAHLCLTRMHPILHACRCWMMRVRHGPGAQAVVTRRTQTAAPAATAPLAPQGPQAGARCRLVPPALTLATLLPRVCAGFLLGQLSSLGSKLTSIMTHHIIPQALTPDQLMSEAKVPTVYGLLTGGWVQRW